MAEKPTDAVEFPFGEWKVDVCAVCGKLLGAGYEAFHLGRCEDHYPRDDEIEEEEDQDDETEAGE
jgi:hypothetical protein